ncbi:MAG: ATP-binding protein [Gammaproteobacteria bacterium]
MEHFPIIQALCRTALAEPNDAVRRQVERLRDELATVGATKEAESLTQLLTGAARGASMSPSRLVRSRGSFGVGEALTPQVGVPVDRETAVPLATIVFPDDATDEPPIFSPDLRDAVKGLIREWSNRAELEALRVDAARSCLIYGAPGTGKTRLALWMCRELGLPAVIAKLDGLVSSFLGTTSRNIGQLFAFAARYKCVLLLDEFDAIAKVRDDPQEVGEIKRVVNTLLQNLDARRQIGLTIGVTNHEALLDSAIWRRFDVQLSVPKPSFEARLEMIRRLITPLDFEQVEVQLLAWLSDGMSGADLESLILSIKKTLVLRGDDTDGGTELIPLLRQILLLHSGRIGSDKAAAIKLDAGELSKILLKASDLKFHQSDLATLFKKNKATVSRWLRDDSHQAARHAT